ncbi:glycosyltransferase family 9 protein [Pelagicoccus albus]|uniref:Glycosyltransferase family 9 protein n=1 Tax=Pelagicoccus albus TaxID=415222 RepID=A0A7X1B4J4_9BACT|nr:glycosyltransferase family 9 protein [Pelagicoccus albus]MBC2605501.1 glycosyltransferase family 9 protein [Pelagicoccus albus]
MAKRVKALVLMTSPLDKIVHALRVMESIKRRKPELEITWVARRVYEPLVAAFDFVDHTITFRRSEALIHSVRLLKQIRKVRYDYVMDLEGYARTGAMCFFAKANRKIGLRSAREGATICYRELVGEAEVDGRHLIEQLQAFATVFGLAAEMPVELNLAPTNASSPFSQKASHSPFVCLFPGRFKSARAWPGMIDLACWLVETRPEFQVYLVGVVPFEVKRKLPDRVYDLQGKQDWLEICNLVKEAELVVANDNGPAQLADALGCPNLTLYSYVSPEMRGSYPLDSERCSSLMAPRGDVSQLEEALVHAEVEKLLSL